MTGAAYRSYTDVVVIGAGAAGMMASVFAAASGASVTVVEKNSRSARKLRITGKGRCNVTNDCTVREFFEFVPGNPKFLYSALNKFSPEDTIAFFEREGVALKTERGRRVFPESDNAHDIADALERAARKAGVKFFFGETVFEILTDKSGETVRVSGVRTSRGVIPARSVIIASGGASYPGTGSTGDGYKFAEALGLGVIPPSPSLVPLETEEKTSHLAGLSLKNVRLLVKSQSEKDIFEDMGELLFTHFGLSGPLVLSASSHMRDGAAGNTVHIDLKPALEKKTLDARLISDLGKYSARDFVNSLGDLLPRTLIPEIVERSGIPPHKRSGDVTKIERRRLLETLKDLSFTVKSFRPLSEAIITRGGVEVSEISPKDMSAKRINGLYFAGEVIDVDAYTGGFNLQIAFSTGRLAGEGAADYAKNI